MIIGTAGHVDHGKTTLVRALTGVDTDRLPEEKARGISIVLGYAYSPLPDGGVLGYVDVPGHEKLLPTMLAGATGIDFVLLVVAADDGVMPQTREHLDIVSLLGVGQGAVALTKVDAVDAVRLAAVRRGIAALTAGTPLRDSPVFEVSAPAGTGIDALRTHLQEAAMHYSRKGEGGHFRLAVDRSFTLAGVGTVVTGTVHAGCLTVGDTVVIAPGGQRARVRSIHAHDRPSSTASAGQRCALNLAGVAREQAQRGDWVVAPDAALGTQRFDGRFCLLASAGRELRSGSAVQVHLGAVHAPARIVRIDGAGGPGEGIAPGSGCVAQIVLQRTVAVWQGDRFIVRDAAANRTLGGGRVLDPFAPARYRRTAERCAVLSAMQAGEPAAQLTALIARAPQGVDLRRFARAANVADLEPLLAPLDMRRIHAGGEDNGVGRDHWSTLLRQAEEALGAFHRDRPDEAGADRGRLKRMAFPRLSPGVYAALLADALATGRLQAAGPWLHLRGHRQAASGTELALMQRLLPRLAQGAFDPPWVRDLAAETGQGESLVRIALLHGAQRGEVYQVVRDLFYHPQAIDVLAARARRLQAAEGEVRAAAFRDATGLGRKRAIQVLEFFDRIGFLRRVQDRHLVRPDTSLNLGEPPERARSTPRTDAGLAQSR